MWGHATPLMIYALSMISDFSAAQARRRPAGMPLLYCHEWGARTCTFLLEIVASWA